MLTSDRLLERGLTATLSAVRRARRRVVALVRRHRHRHADPKELVARVREEIAKAQPELARVLSASLLAAWVTAAREPAREIAPDPDAIHEPPQPPPLVRASAPADPTPPIRWPAVDAAVRELLVRGIVTPARVARLQRDAASAGDEVAEAITSDAAGAVRDAVVAELRRGGGLREFVRNAGEVLEAVGLSDAEVETTFRTQTALARSAGMRAVLDHELIAPEFPYVAYHATHDGRVRDDHLALETCGIGGTNVYRADDPVIRRYWPPWGFRCRCHAQPLSIEDAAARGVPEAMEWARTGEPPKKPAWVADPGFKLPKGWPVRDGRIRAAV